MVATAGHSLRLATSTELVRRRLLPKPGDVLVHVGDYVDADHVVARATIEGQLHAMDVADVLHVNPEFVPRYLQVSEGQTVVPGMELARLRRLGVRLRQLISPYHATVVGVNDGLLFLREEPRPLELKAYVPGHVVEVFPHRGVSIRTQGALVSGIWTSGPNRHGVLVMSVSSPDAALTWQQVGIRYRGTILVGGTLQDPRALYRARQFRVHGLIVGSMRPALRPVCESLGLTVMLTEGMGQIAMAEPAFELLRSLHGHMALIGGSEGDDGSGPEVIIPMTSGRRQASADQPHALQVGMRVRLTRPPYVGVVARVESLPAGLQPTEVGIPAEGVHVRTPDGKRMFVPLANLEVLA